MDGLFQIGKGLRLLTQGLQPSGREGLQTLLDVSQDRLDTSQGSGGLVADANVHGAAHCGAEKLIRLRPGSCYHTLRQALRYPILGMDPLLAEFEDHGGFEPAAQVALDLLKCLPKSLEHETPPCETARSGSEQKHCSLGQRLDKGRVEANNLNMLLRKGLRLKFRPFYSRPLCFSPAPSFVQV